MSLRTVPEVFHLFGNAGTATIVMVPVVAGQRVSVYRLVVTCASPAVTITLQDTTGAALSQTFQLAANGAIVLDESPNGDPWWQTAFGRGLQILQSGTSAIGWDIWYAQRST